MRRLFSSKKTFYEVLNVPPNSTLKEIKSQYYKLCKLSHPDIKHSANKVSSGDFHEILKAYETLKDPEKRRKYDRSLALIKYQPAPSSIKDFEFQPREAKSVDETAKFWSKMSVETKRGEAKQEDKEEVNERLEDVKVFRNRFLVLGAVLIGYLISISNR